MEFLKFKTIPTSLFYHLSEFRWHLYDIRV